MLKSHKKIIEAVKRSNKKALSVYLIVRFLVIVCLILELIEGHFGNAFLCVFSLILFLVPAFLESSLKIEFPSIIESVVYIFIFSATILGEINNFYSMYANFDTILHTINGFICASLGFSLIYILNENIDAINLSPLFVSIVAFCFSMTIGVVWEFYEYAMDKAFKTDMQKDSIVTNINTVILDEKQNKVIKIDGIEYVVAYDKDNLELFRIDGYIDIGLHDTMADLQVNLIGAVIYSIFGYLYIVNKEKYKLAGKFITKKKVLEK